MASMQDSNAKSTNMATWQLGPALNKAGALADISNANRDLEEKIGPQAYAKLSSESQYEINSSSASGLFGDDREALAGFLKLNSADPVAAAKIFNDYLLPTTSGAGVDISPSEFKNNSQSVDSIVSTDMAEGFRSKAKGDAGDQDSDVDVESRSGRPSALKQSVSHAAPHPEKSQKSAKTSKPTALNHTAGNSSRSSSGKTAKPGNQSGTGPRAKVEAALKHSNLGTPDEVRSDIEAGGKIDNGKDTSHMMGRAARNEGSLFYDNTVVAAEKSADTIITKAKDFMNETFGDDDKPQQNNISDNDFPPVPPK
jgi:conjugal transfer mating pair stabilization protein TraG